MRTVKKALQFVSGGYIIFSYAMIFPAICMVLFSSLMAGDYGEEWDRQATAVVTECRNVTRGSRSRAVNENGGPSLSFEVTARYEVNGKEYQISTTGGTHYRVGEQVVISYHSQNPADNYWSDDPVAESRRMKRLHTASGILLLLLIPGCLLGIAKRRKKKDKE